MAEKEYLIFCDESDKHGKYFSNFYGGVIVGASQYQRITDKLNTLKEYLRLFGEVKWGKVTEQYLARYALLMEAFFEEIADGHIRVRIMFTKNTYIPQGLSREQQSLEYYLLYYQFIKHAFGLSCLPAQPKGTRLRLYFDQFPDTGEKVEQFKGYLLGLRESKEFRTSKIVLTPDDIAEISSHNHVLVQCLDIVLGSMSFRLNDKHMEKPVDQRLRGKRTRAKEKLYKAMLADIRKIRPGLNIGITTGVSVNPTGRWSDPYLHWLFVPKDSKYDGAFKKP